MCSRCQRKCLTQKIRAFLNPDSVDETEIDQLANSSPSPSPSLRRHRRLWEMPPMWHCPTIGTCLPVPEMRKIAARCGINHEEMGDYQLHVLVVSQCSTRSPLTERIQRYLDKRYALSIKRFRCVRGEDEVIALWKAAVRHGQEIAGSLWAAWSHPDLTEAGGKEIFGDIHMLSHQMGAEIRADLALLEQLKQENSALKAEKAALQQRLAAGEQEKTHLRNELQDHLARVQRLTNLLARRDEELAQARQAARDYHQLLARSEAMAWRIDHLEERLSDAIRRTKELEMELAETRKALVDAEHALALISATETNGVGSHEAPSNGSVTQAHQPILAGKAVLCIGGKTNLVEGYRRLVEMQGGAFLHHDGGLEENLNRLDTLVAGADAIICQSGCVSHSAYYRIKEACKKMGKPCLFVRSPGLTSFYRTLANLGSSSLNSISQDSNEQPRNALPQPLPTLLVE